MKPLMFHFEIFQIHVLYNAIPIMPQRHDIKLLRIVNVKRNSIFRIFITSLEYKQNVEGQKKKGKTEHQANGNPAEERFWSARLFKQ